MKVVYCTAPLESAKTLAFTLIESRVAACVNLVPQVLSIYRWKDAIEEDEEALLIIKTSDDRLPDLAAAIASAHPYDVPEIVALDVAFAHAPYASWVRSSTTRDSTD